MLAALTMEYSESAFFATVTFTEGKLSSSFFWYIETSPTVSTYSYKNMQHKNVIFCFTITLSYTIYEWNVK